MAVNYFGITDTGKLRDNNEDAFIAEKVLNNSFVMACVIDGVGGYDGGEIAAAIARECLQDYFKVLTGDVPSMMKEAMLTANEKIFTEKQQNPKNSRMACVVTLALADMANNHFYYAHVGDTRLYLLRDDTLVKITRDHSFVGFLEDSGRLSEEAAMQHPKRNESNKALGFDLQMQRTGDYIETGESPFLPGDIILLCSDGLSDLVSNREMISILTTSKTLEEKGKELIGTANNKGGKDNITVVLVQNNVARRKDKATKPAVPVKKKHDRENKAARQEEVTNVIQKPPARNSNKRWVLVLSILSFLLSGALIWLLWLRGQTAESIKNPAGVQKQRTPQEQLLLSTLQQNSGNTVVLADSLYGNTISLTDTLRIQKDTLYIRGNGQTVLAGNSAFRGPAFFLSSSCNYILLENLTFQDFDVAIAAQHTIVQLRNVQFRNCRVPVQYNFAFQNDKAINGRISDTLLLTIDSLPLHKSDIQISYGDR